MAAIAAPTTVLVIEEIAKDCCALHPRTGEPLMFASLAAARIALRELSLSPRKFRVAERTLD